MWRRKGQGDRGPRMLDCIFFQDESHPFLPLETKFGGERDRRIEFSESSILDFFQEDSISAIYFTLSNFKLFPFKLSTHKTKGRTPDETRDYCRCCPGCRISDRLNGKSGHRYQSRRHEAHGPHLLERQLD